MRKAMAAHLVKLDRVRADTTVVPANVSYPTDSGLLSKGVAKLTKTVRAIQALGLARRTKLSGPHPLGAPAGPSDCGVVAPTQRRRQRGGVGTHRRAGPDR